MTAPADSSVPTKNQFIYHTLFLLPFIFFFFFCNYGNLLGKCLKMNLFLLFTMVYSKLTYMLLRQFRLGSNLPTHIKENIDFLPQKPRKLSSAKANFEGWYIHKIQMKYILKSLKQWRVYELKQSHLSDDGENTLFS